jgi:signal peptidase II
VVFVAIMGAGLAADLASKHYVFQWLLDSPEMEATAEQLSERMVKPSPNNMLHMLRQKGYLSRPVGAGLRMTLSLNPGVVFGLPMPPILVSAATLVTVLLVVGLFLTSPARFWTTHVALAMVLAGALGNWYDRVFSSVPIPHSVGGGGTIDRHVRDFIDFSDWEVAGRSVYPWIFNLADVFLVIGVALLMLHWLLLSIRQARSEGD